MGLVLLLLLLALLFGGAGLFIEGLKVLLIVAIVLAVASAFSGYRYYGRRFWAGAFPTPHLLGAPPYAASDVGSIGAPDRETVS